MSDKEILEYYGWSLLSTSPLEIEHTEADTFASGEAAKIVIEHLRKRKMMEDLWESVPTSKGLPTTDRD
jgi:hypothetical protein